MSGSWPLKRWLYDQDHLRINALGLPIAFALTGGEVSDYKGYLPVMNADGPTPKVLLADKGYDADFICEDMKKRGGGQPSLQMIDSTIIRAHQCSAGAKGGLRVRVLAAQKVALRPRSISASMRWEIGRAHV